MNFSPFNFNPNRYTFFGIALGVFAVAALRAMLHIGF